MRTKLEIIEKMNLFVKARRGTEEGAHRNVPYSSDMMWGAVIEALKWVLELDSLLNESEGVNLVLGHKTSESQT